MTRPTISPKDKVAVAIAQAPGGYIVCPLCGHGLLPMAKRILEHMVVRAFTNSDDAKYLAWVHDDCAKLKTYGRKSTCADGDIHKIAKAKRLAREHFGPAGEDKPMRKRLASRPLRGRSGAGPEWASHKFDTSKYHDLKPRRGIPSRPFPKPRPEAAE